jgi:hypothetical protein
MKRTLLIVSLSVMLAITGLSVASAQEQPKPQKDTVNMDTDAKPTFYYATEDEKAPATKKHSVAVLPIVIAGVVVVAGVAAFLVLKNKKKQ